MRKLFPLALLVCLTGCADNLARRDTLAYSGGNAPAVNRILQTIDPWPRTAARRTLAGDGQRGAQAIRRYHNGEAAPAPASIIVPSLSATPITP